MISWMCFQKKNSDILLLYQKYNHKIILEEEQKHYYVVLYKMSFQKFVVVKRYFHSHIAMRFIKANSAPYLSIVLFIKKLCGGMRFYVNY